ncbi:LmeA family phospholipid-binding protein [Gordonia jinhuaensis]|nr:LmeA family phospholipid-binding protein [Gordonia jinhuaensis]
MNEPHGNQPTRPLPDGWYPADGRSSSPQAGPPPRQQPPAGAPGPQPPKRNRGMIVGISALVLVLVVVIAGVGSELYLRHRITACSEKAFGEVTGTSTSVSLSKTPMLWQWASGNTPYFQVDTNDDGNSDGSPHMSLHGRANDVSSKDDGFSAGSLTASGSLPFSRVVDLSNQGSGSGATAGGTDQSGQSGQTDQSASPVQIDKIVGDPSAGTVTVNASVTMLVSIPVEATVTPTITDGKLSFKVDRASALVFGLPTDVAQSIVDTLSSSMFPPVFDKLHFDKLAVKSDGVDFAVHGQDVLFNKETLGPTSGQTNSYSCGV